MKKILKINFPNKNPMLFIFSLTLLTFFIFTGCLTTNNKDYSTEGLIWPPPPAQPRIKWIAEWQKKEDFKKQNPLLTYLIGEEKQKWLFKPNGVVSDDDGNIYVADSTRHEIFVFDMQKNTLRFIGRDVLQQPIGLAMDNKRGFVFVSDSKANRVYALEKNRGYIALTIGTANEFKNPTGLAYDEIRERLYVTDTKNHRIRVYDKDGRFLFTFGQKGQNVGEFNLPSYLAVDKEGKLYVVDSFNFRVQIFNSEGKFIKKFGRLGDASGHFSRPAGIGVDSDGNIYVIDTAFNNFQIFNQDGRLLLWVGSAGRKPGEFYLPTGMFVDKKDKIYVSDTYNRRVQVFQYFKEPPS